MPFATTALLSAVSDENICHFNAVRIRLVGSGNLDMEMIPMDSTDGQVLEPFVMVAATNIQPTRLMNTIEQRAMLKISTDDQDEIFKINRIIIYSKELFSSYPA